MTGADPILIERLALQLFGVQAPQAHLHVAMRGLGLPLTQTAQFFDAVFTRLSELDAGHYSSLTIAAIEDQCSAQARADEPEVDNAFAALQREMLEMSVAFPSLRDAQEAEVA